MVKDQLSQLGFSEKEAAAYMVLLNIGPAVASTLARLTNIKRTSVYDILNSLLERNLISQFKQGHYTYFVVDDVNKLYLYEKEKMEIAKDLVHHLKDRQHLQAGIQIHYYKGKEGYQEIYEDILRMRPEEFIGWIHLDHFYQGLDLKREADWTQERIQKRIHVRLLMQDTPVGRKYHSQDKNSYRETKFFPKENFPFKTTCLLYNSYIILFDPTHDISGIRIHNPELFAMFKAIFELNWKGLDAQST